MEQDHQEQTNGRLNAHVALEALRRAGQDARRVAVDTGTAIVIRENGKLVRISAEQLKAEGVEEPQRS
jgi:tartrate dehydratase alpha subunit/fumarate hydratase class I-like protein